MSRNRLYALFAAEILICILLNAIKMPLSGSILLFSFPLEQIGTALRALSLTGRLGNALALMLYAAICLLPISLLLNIRRKRQPEDYLLGLLSVLLFVVLYLMANGGRIIGLFEDVGNATTAGLVVGKAILGSIVYSVLLAYLVLRALRLFFESGTERLLDYLGILFGLLVSLFIWAIFGVAFGEMIAAFSALPLKPGGESTVAVASSLFIVLRFLMSALPYAMDIAAVHLIVELLTAMKADRFSIETVAAAERLSRWCAFALTVVMLSNASFNILQVLFATSLRTVNSNLTLPVFSIAFALGSLVFARLIAESRRFKGENDLFI